MEPEVAEAMRRVRAWLDGWDRHPPMFAETVVCGSFGGAPNNLDLADLRAVLEEAEGPHEWALVSGSYWDEEAHFPQVHKTFLHEEEAREAFRTSSIPGVWVGWWDDNGVKSCWRER